MPDLRPLRVDLDELAGILEGDPMYGGGRIDLAGTETCSWSSESGQFWFLIRDRARSWMSTSAITISIARTGPGTCGHRTTTTSP
jgi:hypothetical protein